jgi:plastocyanin
MVTQEVLGCPRLVLNSLNATRPPRWVSEPKSKKGEYMISDNYKQVVGWALVLGLLLTPGLYAMMFEGPGNTVNVTLSEYKIDMPSTLTAGMTTFTVTNTGSKRHTLEIKGNSIDEKLKSALKQGESGTMQVELKPGTYTFSCPVGDHEHKGMRLEIKVTQ